MRPRKRLPVPVPPLVLVTLLPALLGCEPVRRVSDCGDLAASVEPLKTLSKTKLKGAEELKQARIRLEQAANQFQRVQVRSKELSAWQKRHGQHLSDLARLLGQLAETGDHYPKASQRALVLRLDNSMKNLKTSSNEFERLCR